jgi:DNA-binding CsgD family transcriptional regulator
MSDGGERGQIGDARDVDIATLSYVERHVLLAFSQGLSRRQIALAMRISPRTVGQALTTAKEKLFARSLTEAAVLLRLHGAAGQGAAGRARSRP